MPGGGDGVVTLGIALCVPFLGRIARCDRGDGLMRRGEEEEEKERPL
jgi:hypothetical protein